MSKWAPSFTYLSSHPGDNGKAFLSDSDGFLPPLPLPALPAPFSEWHTLARQLPSLYESGEWDHFVASLPDEKRFPLHQLSDEHLLRANLALGSIAHAIFHVAKKTIPICIAAPWKNVSDRLGRSIPCLASIDFLLYNPESLPKYEGKKIGLPYNQMRPSITMTSLKAEYNYVLKGYSIEHAARPLPKLVTRAQNAVLNADDEQLRETLIDMIDVLEDMTKAFAKPDSRPLNKLSMDTVDWSRSIDISASPVQQGEKGGSGLLFPSIHLLDAFFCRKKYETELGKLEKHERSWLPQIHREFFSKVAETSTLEYLLSSEKKALLVLFRRALLAFGGESGFLGKHRIRLTGYLEIMFKIGREATGNGMGQSVSWDRRIWRVINETMKQSMRERVGMKEDWYTEASVKAVSPIPGCHAFRVLIDGNGAFQYKPGDLLGILPENRDSFLHSVLHLLNKNPDSKISVTDRQWIRLLACRGLPVTAEELVDIKLIDFLRYAKLQPLDRQLGSRMAQAMSINDPFIVSLLQAEEATNVKGVLQLLKHVGFLSAEKLVAKLDEVFEPLTPRYYSVSSHIGLEPRVVEIVVGPVQYKAKGLISNHSSLSISAKRLQDYSKNVVSDVSSLASAEDSTDQDGEEHDAKRRRTSAKQQRIFERSASFLYLRENSDSATQSPFSLVSDGDTEECTSETLHGISSSYLRSLSPGSLLTVRVVPTLDFHMPQDPTIPLIMISQGTGFAPFRPFLKELILRKRRCGSQRRKSWLILGVKTRHEIPFIEDIEEAVCTEKVAELSLAISREDFEVDTSIDSPHLGFRPSPRKHLSDLFSGPSNSLRKLWDMVQDEGHIFVCGKPDLELMTRHMLAAAARKYSPNKEPSNGNSEDTVDPTCFADSLCANKRLHADCYDSGKPEKLNDTYTPAEVARHRTSRDCWVTFRNGVYDISEYLQVHPGGPKLLLEKAGQDITEDFNTSHGADNYRVASMLHSYKIAHLEQFSEAHDSMRSFMKEWSVPLLAGIQERQGVFSLDWNNFEDIDFYCYSEHAAGRYTKHNEAHTVLQKFMNCYEPKIFEFLRTYVAEKLDEQLGNVVGKDKVFNTESIVTQLESIRKEGLEHHRNPEVGNEEKELHQRLKQCAKFMEEYTSLAVEIQSSVEFAALCSQRSRIEEVVSKMLENIFHCVANRTKYIYKLLLEG